MEPQSPPEFYKNLSINGTTAVFIEFSVYIKDPIVEQSQPQVTCLFPRFSQLPAELRLKIWASTLEPRVVAVSPTMRSLKPYLPPPAIFGACRESRLEALRQFDVLDADPWMDGRLCYFNFSKDTLQLKTRKSLIGYHLPRLRFLSLTGVGTSASLWLVRSSLPESSPYLEELAISTYIPKKERAHWYSECQDYAKTGLTFRENTLEDGIYKIFNLWIEAFPEWKPPKVSIIAPTSIDVP